MLGTPGLHRLTELATQNDWRLSLIRDPRQLQAAGRGGMFSELCNTGRTIELERVHRFSTTVGSTHAVPACSWRGAHGRQLVMDPLLVGAVRSFLDHVTSVQLHLTRLRPMRGLKADRTATVISEGRASSSTFAAAITNSASKPRADHLAALQHSTNSPQ